MSRSLRKRLKIGDVVEIPTDRGLAYAQYTHNHKAPPTLGHLVRVLQGFYTERPSIEELASIVKQPHRFSTFATLGSMVFHEEALIIDNFPIPDFAKSFPIFKNTNAMDPHKKDAIWWLWDGETSKKVGPLSEEEKKKYPMEMVCNSIAFIDTIKTGKDYQGMVLC